MHTSVRRWALAGALALAVAPLPAPAQPAPYELNAILPLTGPAAFIGQTTETTLRIVEKQINATGGIHGRPVRFVVADDQSSPQVDVQLMNGLIARHVPVIFDGGPLAMCKATTPLVANGPVVYCLSPALYPPGGGYVFSTSASSEDETHALVNFMHGRHWKRVAIITPTDATGQEADRVLHDLFALPQNRDMTIVEYEHFNPTDISVNAQMEKIKSSRPDVVMGWGTGAATATEYRAMKDVDLNVPVVGSNGNQQYAVMAQWATILPSDYYQYAMKWPAYKRIGAGPVKDAMSKMYAAFAAEGQRPDVGASLVWDPALIVAAALRALPEPATPQQVRDYILQLHGFAGINGFYDFRVGNQRGLGLKDCIVVRWDGTTKTFVPVSGAAGGPL